MDQRNKDVSKPSVTSVTNADAKHDHLPFLSEAIQPSPAVTYPNVDTAAEEVAHSVSSNSLTDNSDKLLVSTEVKVTSDAFKQDSVGEVDSFHVRGHPHPFSNRVSCSPDSDVPSSASATASLNQISDDFMRPLRLITSSLEKIKNSGSASSIESRPLCYHDCHKRLPALITYTVEAGESRSERRTQNVFSTEDPNHHPLRDENPAEIQSENSASVRQANVALPLSRTESDTVCCRICQESDKEENLVSPCFCTGTIGYMHITCLEKWLCTNGRTQCELCSFPYPVERILPSLWEYFRRPTNNMDFSSLVCDMSCFTLLTPLLVASTYLCSIGVKHYQAIGKVESVFAIITLMVSLIAVYFAWAAMAFTYHYRVWLTWCQKSAHIRISADKSLLTMTSKPLSEGGGGPTATNQVNSSRLATASAILRPFLRYKRIITHTSCNSIPDLGIPNNAVPSQ